VALFFEEFVLGSRMETPARTVTEADVVLFAGLSGDYNPIHTDAAFAAKTPFGERIAHGALGLALVTGLSGRTGVLDGTALAFLGIDEWKFHLPIRIGDTILVRWTVAELREISRKDAGVLRRRMELVNQKEEVVQSGIFSTMVRRRAAGGGKP